MRDFLICVRVFLETHDGAITAVATVLLMINTGALAWIGYRQIVTTRAQLRPYVFIDSGSIVDGATPPNVSAPAQTGCPNSGLLIKNSGVTPAFKTRHWSAVKLTHVTLDARLPAGVLDAPADITNICSPTTIAPGATSTLTRNLMRTITPYEIGLLANPAFAIISYGKITYEDSFGIQHETNYCLGYAGAYPRPTGTILVYMTDGNSAT